MSEFGTLDLAALEEHAKRLNTEKNNFQDLYVPMPKGAGTITVRILPPAKGQSLFQETRLHTLKKPEQDRGPRMHCPRPLRSDGKWDHKFPCIICEYYNSLYRQFDILERNGSKVEAAAIQAAARAIKPVERYYYNVIVRKLITDNGEEINAGPRILSVGKQLHKLIVDTILGSNNTPQLDVTNIKNGYDFIIRNDPKGSGKDAFPNYDRSFFARESSPAGTPEEIRKWAVSLHDLSALRIIKDADYLKKELARYKGLIPDFDDGFDNDAFEAEFRPKATAPASQEEALQAAMSQSDSFDEFINSEASTEPVTEAVAEDITIEDEEFINDLKNMQLGE